jgi:hypothetical protein
VAAIFAGLIRDAFFARRALRTGEALVSLAGADAFLYIGTAIGPREFRFLFNIGAAENAMPFDVLI